MRHLGALRRAMHSLDTYYQEYSTNPTLPLRNPTHPYPTSFVSRDGSVQHFTYVYHMTGRNLFFGLMDDTAICIKFVPRYCKEGHEFLAAKGFAPKLHAFERLPGGLYMVVMDDVGDLGDARQLELSVAITHAPTMFARFFSCLFTISSCNWAVQRALPHSKHGTGAIA
jgi:hypothetical protein